MVSIRCLTCFVCTFFVAVYYRCSLLRIGLMLATFLGTMGTVILSVGSSFTVYALGTAVLGIAFGLGTMFPVSLLI